MYNILSEEEYTNTVKKMLTWGKTTIESLEHDDLSITSQIMESSLISQSSCGKPKGSGDWYPGFLIFLQNSGNGIWILEL